MRQYAGFGTAAESNRRYRYLLAPGRQRPQRRVRSADADGLRLGSPAGDRRSRPGRRRDRLDRGHGELVRRHPARSRLDVDDDQRDGHHPAGAVRRRRAAAGRRVRPRSPARSRTTSSRNTSRAGPTSTRRARRSGSSPTSSPSASASCRTWNTISISGYHIREAGSTAVEEVAFTFANAIAYVQAAIDAGLDVDRFGQRLSFFFNAHNDFLEEIAKFRAARRLWARIMRERFGATQPARRAAALSHPDGRQHAHRPAARQQHRPRRAPGAGGGARRDAVAALQRTRRGAGAADRGGGADRAPDAADHRGGNRRRRTPSIRSAARTRSRR